jgi:hypothetical protein
MSAGTDMSAKDADSKLDSAAHGGCPATTCYRLLNFDDEIEGSDEFLEDDAVTWTRLDIQHRWNVGGWWHANLKPMRRKIPRDNSVLTQPDIV